MAGMVTVAWREQMVYRAGCSPVKRSPCVAAQMTREAEISFLAGAANHSTNYEGLPKC
jgi:hypothetical protein